MGVLPCPLPCQSDSDQSNPKTLYSDSSSSSSKSFSSLASQPSLPSVPSLTASISSLIEQPFSSKASHHCLATLKGGGSYIFCLSLAGKHLYCGSSNGDILVSGRDPSQDGNSNSELRLVARSGSAVKSIVILGDKLISAHQDHRIRVWKIDNELTHHHHHQRKRHCYYKCIATLPTLNDRCMKLFSAKNYVKVRRHKKCTWVHHVDTVSAMALSPDAALLYSVSWDRTLKLWRTSDFKCLQSVWNAHDDAVNAVALSPDGRLVYTGSADKTIKVWRVDGGSGDKRLGLAATLEKHKSTVNALALCSDGSVLYSGACDRSIIVWEKDRGTGPESGPMVVAGALRGHTKAILSLAVVAELVLSGSADKTVRMWKKGVGKSYFCLGVLEGHSGPVKCLTASLDKNNNNSKDEEGTCGNSYMVYSGGLDCDVKVWRIWVPNNV